MQRYWSGNGKNSHKNPNLELFNLHLSELILEVEGIKLRAERNDIGAIKEHLERMNAVLLEIMDARMGLAEKCANITN
ncbi:MAG: hypothetical protein ACREAN_03110 [Nitrosopumilaceae archaeon]